MADVRLSWEVDEGRLVSSLERIEQRLNRIEGEMGEVGRANQKAFGKAQKSAQSFDKELRKSQSSIGKTVNLFRGLAGAVGAAFSVVAIGQFTKEAVRLYDQQEKAVRKVEQALKSTGQAAGLSLRQLTDEATRLQGQTLFGDEEILNGATAQLLTFTNIAGDEFLRTQEAALNLSTVLDQDLKSASIQLGKALNDPVANLSALSRSGIQFSDEQKELIKTLADTNRLAEAQGVILDELERQYGGQARAAVTGAGAIQQLQNKIGDLFEAVGAFIVNNAGPFVRFIDNITTGLTNFLTPAQDAEQAVRDLQTRFNFQIQVLKEGNLAQKDRNQLIQEINRSYGEYLPNLLSEEASIKEIERAQRLANEAFQQKILFVAFEEEIAEALEKSAEAARTAAAAERARIATQERAADIQDLPASIQNLADQQAETYGLIAQGQLEFVKETEQRTAEIRETYDNLAEQAGFSFDEIISKFSQTTQATQNLGGQSRQSAKEVEELEKALSGLLDRFDQDVTDARLNSLIGFDRLVAERDLALQEVDAFADEIRAKAAELGRELPANFEQSVQALKDAVLDEFGAAVVQLERDVIPALDDLNLDPPPVRAEVLTPPPIEVQNAFEKLKEDILKTLNLDEADFQFFQQQLGSIFSNLAQGVTAATDAQIAQQDQLISKIDERIQATEEALNRELELQEEGFANNVDIEKERLETLQAEREKQEQKRLEFEKKAANQRLAIEAAQQASSLATGAARVISATANQGLLGVAFAIAAIASFFRIFQQAKAQAAQASTATELRGGGLFDGPGVLTHEEQRKTGRVHRIGNSRFAIEKGEWIIGTEKSKKHGAFLSELNAGRYDHLDLSETVIIPQGKAQIITDDGRKREVRTVEVR